MACQRQGVRGLVKDLGLNAEPFVEICACMDPGTEALTWRVSLVIDLPLCLSPIHLSNKLLSRVEIWAGIMQACKCLRTLLKGRQTAGLERNLIQNRGWQRRILLSSYIGLVTASCKFRFVRIESC